MVQWYKAPCWWSIGLRSNLCLFFVLFCLVFLSVFVCLFVFGLFVCFCLSLLHDTTVDNNGSILFR